MKCLKGTKFARRMQRKKKNCVLKKNRIQFAIFAPTFTANWKRLEFSRFAKFRVFEDPSPISVFWPIRDFSSRFLCVWPEQKISF